MLTHEQATRKYGKSFADALCVLRDSIQRQTPAPLGACTEQQTEQDSVADTSETHSDKSRPESA